MYEIIETEPLRRVMSRVRHDWEVLIATRLAQLHHVSLGWSGSNRIYLLWIIEAYEYTQFRPKTLDDLHYHEGLSLRLKSLVCVLFSPLCLQQANISLTIRPLLGTFPICYFTARRALARKRALAVLWGSCLGTELKRYLDDLGLCYKVL